jgi:hypothetical protein
MRGLSWMPLEESPTPIRCAWLSQTCAASRPSQAAIAAGWRASVRGVPGRQEFQKPFSGQNFQAARDAAPVRTPPTRNARLFRPASS